MTSSTCPAAYCSVSNAVFIDQYTTRSSVVEEYGREPPGAAVKAGREAARERGENEKPLPERTARLRREVRTFQGIE